MQLNEKMVRTDGEPKVVATNINPKMVGGLIIETEFHVFNFPDINIYVYEQVTTLLNRSHVPWRYLRSPFLF